MSPRKKPPEPENGYRVLEVTPEKMDLQSIRQFGKLNKRLSEKELTELQEKLGYNDLPEFARKKFVSIHEAVKETGVPQRKLMEQVKNGTVRGLKSQSGRWYIAKSSIQSDS